jgi:glycosyltransferase involved in cell wall biosynthesis
MDLKFSIIIPVYNVEEYLRESLDSALCQEYYNFEVICINDGSTDQSLAILEEYFKKYPNMVIINKENEGVSAARNAGLLQATGDYILFLDSDDFYYHNGVLSILSNIAKKQDCDCIYFPGGYIEAEWTGRETYDNREYESGWACLSDNCRKSKILVFGSIYAQCFKRKIIFENELLFDTSLSYGEDRLFTIKFFYYAKKTLVYSDPLYCYRIRPNSLMTSINLDKKISDGLKVPLLLWNFCKEKNISFRENICTYINGLYVASFLDAHRLKKAVPINKQLLFSTSIGIKRQMQSEFLSINPNIYLMYKYLALKIVEFVTHKY